MRHCFLWLLLYQGRALRLYCVTYLYTRLESPSTNSGLVNVTFSKLFVLLHYSSKWHNYQWAYIGMESHVLNIIYPCGVDMFITLPGPLFLVHVS